MAKTIGKERGSGIRARAAADAKSGSAGDPSNDEPRDEDTVMAEEDGAELEDEQIVLPARAVVQRQPAPVAHTGIPEPLMANPLTRFIIESYYELRKVTWPTPREAWNMTLIVIAMSALVAAVLGAADFGLVRALTWVVSLGSGAPGATPTSTPTP